MRRSEKIRRFLKEHPRATERELQKKFGLSFREAEESYAEVRGAQKPGESPRAGRDRMVQWLKRIFLSEKKTLLLLIGAAASVRLLYVFFLSQHEVLRLPLLDAEYYLKWAEDIVRDGWLGDKIFFTEPFYAYALAFFLKIFGEAAGSFFLLGLQFVLGTLFPVLLYFVGKNLLSRPIGVAAGLIAAFYGPFIFYDGLLLKTSLEVYSIPLILLFFWRTIQNPRSSAFFLLGLLLGVVALIKGNVLVFAPLLCLLVFFFLKQRALVTRLARPYLVRRRVCCGSRRRRHIPATLIHSKGAVPARDRGPGHTAPTWSIQVEGMKQSFTAFAAPPPYSPKTGASAMMGG